MSTDSSSIDGHDRFLHGILLTGSFRFNLLFFEIWNLPYFSGLSHALILSRNLFENTSGHDLVDSFPRLHFVHRFPFLDLNRFYFNRGIETFFNFRSWCSHSMSLVTYHEKLFVLKVSSQSFNLLSLSNLNHFLTFQVQTFIEFDVEKYFLIAPGYHCIVDTIYKWYLLMNQYLMFPDLYIDNWQLEVKFK